MDVLTHLLGPFPIGIWAVLAMLLVGGGLFTLFGQVLSLVSWDTALRLRLQEDARRSRDPVERTMLAMLLAVGIPGALVVVCLVVNRGFFRW